MKKHIRLINKSLQKNIRGVKLTCLMVLVLLAHLYFSTGLKRFFFKDLKENAVDDFHDSYIQFLQSNSLENIQDVYEWKIQSLHTSAASNNSSPSNQWNPVTVAEVKERFEKNCGLKNRCSLDSFPVHLFTGVKNEILPQICINEKYLSLPGKPNIGRGFNIAVVNSASMEVVRFGNFDTFSEASLNMEVFLEVLNEDDIVIVVTHDEASTKLSSKTRFLFSELGSSLIQDLDYRDVWVFVGQKGMQGFSSIEYIELAVLGNQWPRSINTKICVHKKLDATIIRPDILPHVNVKKRVFCAKTHSKNNLCKRQYVDRPLSTSSLTDMSLVNSSIFRVPIVIIPGVDVNVFRMQAEALLLHPGLHTNMVHVFLPRDEIITSEFARLFVFNVHLINESFGTTKYADIFHKSLEKAWELFDHAEYCIILEEAVIPSNDFLSYLSACLNILERDDTLAGASAWNINSYGRSLNMSTLATRVEVFPGLGVLMRRSIYEMFLRNKLSQCCSQRSWKGWNVGSLETLVPYVSRVYRVPLVYDELDSLEVFKRSVNIDHQLLSKIENMNDLVPPRYDFLLSSQLSTCIVLTNDDIVKICDGLDNFILPAKQSHSIYYKQENTSDTSSLLYLLNCFKVHYSSASDSFMRYKHLTRIMDKRRNIFMVGSLSPFATHLPKVHEYFNLKQTTNIKNSKNINNHV